MTRATALKTVAKFLGKYETDTIVELNYGGQDLTLATKTKVWSLTYEDIFNVADVIKSKQFKDDDIAAKFNKKFLTYSK